MEQASQSSKQAGGQAGRKGELVDQQPAYQTSSCSRAVPNNRRRQP